MPGTSLKKKGHVYHFRNVLSNFKSWVDSKRIYDQIKKPVNLIYGSHDWATDTDKIETKNLLGIEEFEIIENCGHFSFLEKPEKVVEILLRKNLTSALSLMVKFYLLIFINSIMVN